MTNSLKFVLFLTSTLCAEVFAQTASKPNDEAAAASTSSSPAAYVYVSRTPAGSNVNEIEAFAAAPNGKLTKIAGSPFQENVTFMAVNGKRLFAANSNGFDIESYNIESHGALHYASTTNAAESRDCNALGPLFFDNTGKSLYDMEINGSGCDNNTYESFAVYQSTGELNNMGNSSANSWLTLPASFIGNNVYAYTASCIQDTYWGIYGFKRSGKGLLTEININANPPNAPDGDFYCPSQAAADPKDHVAIAMDAIDLDFNPDRPPQLATYTADAKGNLSTKSTRENMPETSVGNVIDLTISPSGKLLAVGGTGGLQIFHFNGSDPITRYTGLLTKDEIDQFLWDDQDHLYAISQPAGKLFVFTVTPESHSQAPDSPYSIGKPQNIVVQPAQ